MKYTILKDTICETEEEKNYELQPMLLQTGHHFCAQELTGYDSKCCLAVLRCGLFLNFTDLLNLYVSNCVEL